MEIGIKQKNGVVFVAFRGDLDLTTADECRQTVDRAIEAYAAEKLVFDLSRVRFIDSSGLGMILGRYKTMRRKNGHVAICGVQAQLDRMIEVAGLRKLVPVYGTAQEAAERM